MTTGMASIVQLNSIKGQFVSMSHDCLLNLGQRIDNLHMQVVFILVKKKKLGKWFPHTKRLFINAQRRLCSYMV